MMTKAQLNKTSTTPKATATRIIKPLQQTVTVGKSKENLLQRIEQLSNAGQLDEALDLCQQALSEVGPDAELFYLWGLLLDSMGQQSNAEKYYRKALYMDPLHAAALKQLAALLRAQGHTAAAMLLEQRIKFDRT
jgi:chemotaxis protein methyltransferase WspC